MSILLQAQITKTVIPTVVEQVAPFDSTKNWHGNKNVSSFIGQQLYFLPKHERFYMNITSDAFDANVPYCEICGHTFDIIDVSPYNRDEYHEEVYTLKLKDIENNKIYYYSYKSNIEPISPDYIFVSYFNYLKTIYVGQEYVVLPPAISLLKSHSSPERVYNKDINTGKEITYNPRNNCYKIIDVTVSDERAISPIFFLISNGEHTTYFTSNVLLKIKKKISESIVKKAEWESLSKKYGATLMDCVVKGEIKVGMPERLLILSWGYPDSIRENSYGDDQFIYRTKYEGNKYVYVSKKGIITAWN